MKKLILSIGLLVLGFSSLVSCSLLKHEHTYDFYQHNDKEHWQECTVIGCHQVVNKEEHHGGTATCTDLAVCEDCGIKYGNKKEHVFVNKIDDAYLINKGDCENDTLYYKSCACGEKSSETFIAKAAAGHNFPEWSTKTPATCENAEIEHRVCLVEGCSKEEVRNGDSKLGHDLEIKHDEEGHYEECIRDNCSYKTTKENHSNKLVPNDNLTHNVVCEDCERVIEKNVTCTTSSSATCTEDALCLCGNVVEEHIGHINSTSGYTVEKGKLYYSIDCICGELSKNEVTGIADVSNEKELKTVLEYGFDAKLVSDITLSSPIVLNGNGVDSTLDLNGKKIEINKITVSETQFGNRNIVEAILVKNKAKLTINGDGLIYSHYEDEVEGDVFIEVLSAIDEAVVTINGGSYLTNGCTAIYATRGAIVNIYDGRYEANSEYYDGEYTLDINESEANVGTINVYGGEFVNYDPTNATNDGNYKNKVVEGYCCISIAGEYIVSKHQVVVDEGYEATCVEKGLTEGSHCTRCNNVLVPQEEILELGHDYSTSWIDSLDHKSHIIGCLNCGLASEEELHYGGTPTLTNRPVCAECGLEYSSLLIQEDAKPSGTIEFLNSDCENGVSVNDIVISIDEYTTITFSKGTGSAPKYYDSSSAIHVYKGNTWTITSSQVIKDINITTVKSNALSNLLDKIDVDGAIIGNNIISNINDKSFTITHVSDDENTQCRIKSITVNYATPEPTRVECPHTEIIYVDNNDGTHTKKCKECSASIKIENCYVKTSPTCEEDGFCVCNSKVEDKLGHTYGDLINGLDSTCTEDGYKSHYYCEVCDTYFDEDKEKVKYDELIIEKEHKGLEIIIEGYQPTCEEEGLKDLIYCNSCEKTVQTQDVILPLGHDICIDKAVSPTCTETGLLEGSHCSRCNDKTIEQEVVDALGHSHPESWSYVDSYYHGKECSRCHEVELELHDDGTNANSGVRICETCGEEYGVGSFYEDAKVNEEATLDATRLSGKATGYSKISTYDNWIISGGSNNSAKWDYFKLGGKSETLNEFFDIFVATNSAVSSKISKIEVVLGDGSGTTEGRHVSSWYLIVSSDSEFTTVIDRIEGKEIVNKSTTYTFTPTSGISWPENSYYKVVFDCYNTTKTDGIVVLSKVNLYDEPKLHEHSYDPTLTKEDTTGYVQVCTCGDSTKKELH